MKRRTKPERRLDRKTLEAVLAFLAKREREHLQKSKRAAKDGEVMLAHAHSEWVAANECMAISEIIGATMGTRT
jgi:hypothetical protein